MKYKKIAITAVIIILIIAAFIALFCYNSFSVTYGYDKSKHNGYKANTVRQKMTVIIDAGHGGIDPGAVCNGAVEKDLNLKVALKLADFLALSDFDVIMTRSTDTLLGTGNTVKEKKLADLNERLKLMNSNDGCVFVSIHMNKYTAQSARGLQTFYASSSLEAKKLAEYIQSVARQSDSNNKRQIKPDDGNIYILKNTGATAVLVECGFLSNTEECSLLKTDDYQNKTAFDIYCGIIKYLQEKNR